jgi:hypothetical protein
MGRGAGLDPLAALHLGRRYILGPLLVEPRGWRLLLGRPELAD